MKKLTLLSFLLIAAPLSAKTIKDFAGCDWVIPGYYKTADEPTAVHHFRNFKNDKSLEVIAFYNFDIQPKKYAEHDYLKLMHSAEFEGTRLDSYQLSDESVGFGAAHIEFSLSANNQSVVIVTDDFNYAQKLLTKCVDESLVLQHLTHLTRAD
ncbi:hypothetical protein MN202_17945 [Rheinheimera muenzenbergensis]|uniref:Uncharacterized protein n=1 Tax=Rheinheimera muenzenbergensis TaxID=1193628 RepID=A0ABU8CB89_9GAMM